MSSSPADAPAGGGAPPAEPPVTFLDMPCDLVSCLGPVANTPGYAEEMDGTQCICRTARDDTMLGAATANLRYGRLGRMRSRLQYACMMNDEPRVSWLLDCGARHVAAAAEDGYKNGAALVRRLAADPLVDARDALVASVHVGAADLVAPLVARITHLEGAAAVDRATFEMLNVASWRGHVGVVAALLAAGADVDAPGADGSSSLTEAACNGHLETVQALVAAGADINRRDDNGGSAASYAIRGGCEAVAAYLCALPQAAPGTHIAAAAWLGDVELVRNFIARGADVEERGSRDRTCLALAARRGHVEVVCVLLEAGADVAAVTRHYIKSVLDHSVGKPAILALLLERFVLGGDAARQRQLNRALRRALSDDTPAGAQCVGLLVKAGAI
jgi:hypothetical protein